MLQALVKKGAVYPEEVPAPSVSKGAVLIKVVNSCISAGTELGAMQSSGQSLIRKALAQPEKLKLAISMARSEGIAKVVAKIQGKLDAGVPTGYSIAGTVLAAGEGVTGFRPGDRVAAAGAGLANHAEYVDVPQNLVMKIPEGLDFDKASTVTLGGIAMQGIRRTDPKLGEYVVVLGAGILGLLSVQMLKAAGARVAAIDLDPGRLDVAASLGAELIVNPQEVSAVDAIVAWSGGHGADRVIIAAATSSSKPLADAFKMTRKKGTVVLVGVVNMQIDRQDIYSKELDFQISTSYGPGRYDREYEEKGLDYPYAYVRWTENRNMAEYLRLLKAGIINLAPLINAVYPISEVAEAFAVLQRPEKPLMVLLRYDDGSGVPGKEPERTVHVGGRPVKDGWVNLALIGAGAFAQAIHGPNLVKLKDKYRIHCVMSRTGTHAKAAAQKYEASYATTDYQQVLNDGDVDAVMICTRHDSHAALALQALRAGKHVFVEKPLAISRDQLDGFRDFYADGTQDRPVLFVGFNRRFSVYASEIKKHVSIRSNPLVIHYRMNAGFQPYDQWVHEDGGRIVGEGCHIIDLFSYLVGHRVVSVSQQSMGGAGGAYRGSDNTDLVLAYEDGSIASLQYFSCGSRDLPKESMEIHFDGKSIVMDNYRQLTGYGVRLADVATPQPDKGHFEELLAFHNCLNSGGPWPIGLQDILQTTEITLACR